MISSIATSEVDAEQAVLGSILLKPEVIDDVSFLEERDFAEERHRLIWVGLKYLNDHDQPIDLVTLTEMLKNYKRLDEVGGVFYLGELQQVPTAEHASYYAKKVQQKATLRRVMQEAKDLYRLAEKASTEEASDLVASLDKLSEKIQPNHSAGLKHIGEMDQTFWDSIDREDDKLKTGFAEFDKWSGGIKRGWLYILAGRPGAGKTAKMLQMAVEIAKQQDGEVLIWSQEMDYVSLLYRIVASQTKVPYRYMTVEKEKLDATKRKQIKEGLGVLKKLPLHVDDASGATIDRIHAAAKQMKKRKGKLGAILVDYLQIMHIQQAPGVNRAQAIGHVTTTAKHIARSLDCPFIMLSQLNREKEKDVVPHLGHLKESSSIEQDADVIDFLYEHPDDAEKPIGFGSKYVRSRIAKAREVGQTEIICTFDGWRQHFTEIRQVTGNEDEGAKKK